MKEVKAGDRVQFVDDQLVKDGVVVSIVPPLRSKPSDYWDTRKYSSKALEEMVTFANVKWDNGDEEKIDIDELDPQDSELERQFRITANETLVKIQEQVSLASAALSRAVTISEECGIPFDSEISFLNQSYFPSSLEDKFTDLDRDFVESITGATSGYDGAGWEHSAVCY